MKLTKEICTSICIATILIGFYLFKNYTSPTYKILKVVNTDEFYIDLNRNYKIDSGELVKLYGINAFQDEKSFKTRAQIITTGFTLSEVLGIGVLAKEFSQKNFANKKVKFVPISENSQYLYARLYLDNMDIAQLLVKNGYAIASKEERTYLGDQNYLKMFELKEQVKTEDIRIINLKNNTYHKIDCPYTKNLKQAKALRKVDIDLSYVECDRCKNKSIANNDFKLKKFDFSYGKLNFYFTDFNKRQKPDNNCQNKACEVLINEIDSAKYSIDFAIYGYSNQAKVLKSLFNAQNRGVRIRWVTDADMRGQNIYPEIIEMQKVLSDFRTDNHIIDSLGAKDSKYTNAIMHNKFFIFDNKKVWTGSANISQTDLADFNANIVLLADSKELAEIYLKEFEQMYNQKFHYLKSPISGKENIEISKGILVSIYFSPIDNIIQTKIIPMIDKSKDYIYISSFVITEPNIKSALINAKNRGVDVKVITDATSASKKFSVHNYLRKAGIQVKVENKAGKMHSKSLVIDDKYTILGSMNLTKSGNNKNDENMIVLENSYIATIFKKHFMYLWASIPTVWLNNNPIAESKESLGSCSDGIDNDFDGFVDKEDSGCLIK